MDKNKTIEILASNQEEKILLSHILDLGDRCRNRNIPILSEFLTPAEQEKCKKLCEAAGFSNVDFQGGTIAAERKRICFAPDWTTPDEVDPEICCLKVTHYADDHLSHRDYLGSLMGLGIERNRVGDILVIGEDAYVLADQDMVAYLKENWGYAGRTKLKVEEVSLDSIPQMEIKVKEIRDTVASLRLDAVLSSGFSMSRNKACDYINAGHVQVNYEECLKADFPVKQGDIFSVRGLGKCVLEDTSGLSKKGRIGILLHRYL